MSYLAGLYSASRLPWAPTEPFSPLTLSLGETFHSKACSSLLLVPSLLLLWICVCDQLKTFLQTWDTKCLLVRPPLYRVQSAAKQISLCQEKRVDGRGKHWVWTEQTGWEAGDKRVHLQIWRKHRLAGFFLASVPSVACSAFLQHTSSYVPIEHCYSRNSNDCQQGTLKEAMSPKDTWAVSLFTAHKPCLTWQEQATERLQPWIQPMDRLRHTMTYQSFDKPRKQARLWFPPPNFHTVF